MGWWISWRISHLITSSGWSISLMVDWWNHAENESNSSILLCHSGDEGGCSDTSYCCEKRQLHDTRAQGSSPHAATKIWAKIPFRRPGIQWTRPKARSKWECNHEIHGSVVHKHFAFEAPVAIRFPEPNRLGQPRRCPDSWKEATRSSSSILRKDFRHIENSKGGPKVYSE